MKLKREIAKNKTWNNKHIRNNEFISSSSLLGTVRDIRDDFSNFLMSMLRFKCIDLWSSLMSLTILEENGWMSLFICCLAFDGV